MRLFNYCLSRPAIVVSPSAMINPLRKNTFYLLLSLFLGTLSTGLAQAKAIPYLEMREEGKGLTDHGGGGTFINTRASENLVFWDLFARVPGIQDLDRGDQIKLTRKGKRLGGEWVDYRQFRSYQFLLERLDLWKEQMPRLTSLLEKAEGQDLAFIATPMAIFEPKEISVIESMKFYKKNFRAALPGAVYNYSTGFLFVNSYIWNRSGSLSQSAMLLHERLRHLQLSVRLSNKALQEIVYNIILVSPETADANLIAKLDLKFPESAEGLLEVPEPSSYPQSALEEVKDALRRKLLTNFVGASHKNHLVPNGDLNSD